MAKPKQHQSDYDSPWKEVIERFFPQFMAFFFPKAHAGIDWSKGYTFLDKEFQKVTRDAKTGKRYVDKLVQVYLLDGQETWVLVHLEVQGAQEETFAQRMFVYYYRIFDQYQRRIASLGVLTDDNPAWRPTQFSQELFECRVSLDFPTVKLLDYQDKLSELAVDPNPFALVVLAHLHTQTTRQQPVQRYDAKLTLVKYLYHRGYQRQEIEELLRFIDWIMTLPPGLEMQLREDVAQLEAEATMRYVTSFERLAAQDAKVENARQFILRTLNLRFGQVPPPITELVEAIDGLEVLELLHDKAVTISSLAMFEDIVSDYQQ